MPQEIKAFYSMFPSLQPSIPLVILMDKVIRTGVSIEPELLKEFDRIIAGEGYGSRSEAIRDLIREKLIKSAWRSDGGEVMGTVTIVYNHHSGGVMERLMEAQHSVHSHIAATTHVHFTHELCVEVIIAKGTAGDVKRLADRLKSIKGVLHAGLVMTSPAILELREHRHEHERR